MVKILTAAATVAAFGWGAHEYVSATYASSTDVVVAQAQIQFILDRQISALVREIAYLERKKNKTAEEWDQLRLLRQQLQELRRVRAGK